ncbi:MAG: hypothetical protein IKT52_05125 [Oscillospiraceae bacterium]|nr:hypothetical protein [Oscillospiraceae bacterium]
MMLPIAVFIAVLTFAVQLALCFCARRKWIKCIPIFCIAAGELACAAVYFLYGHVYGAAFAAVIYAMVLLILLAGDALAWLIHHFVKRAQNHK